MTIYLSQYEGDSRITKGANELFRWNIVQGLGQQLRHHHLAYRRESGLPASSEWLFEKAKEIVGDDLFLSLLLCHNHTRSMGLRDPELLKYEQMALPWEKIRA